MIEQLGLDSQDMKLFCINDNAANMKLGIRLSRYLTEYNCDIPTFELVIKDAVTNTPSMVDVFKNTKAIAKFAIKSPSVALPELKKPVVIKI